MGGNDTTIGLPFELRDKIKSMKIIDDETYPSVLRRIIEQAEKVPALDKEISVLKRRIQELEGENENLNAAIDGMASFERERAKEVSDGMYKE